MAEYTGEVLPLNTNINPATGKPVGAVADALFKEAKDTAKKKMEEETSPESLLSSPPAMVTYGAMAAEAARRAAPYIKDFFTQPQVPERIEPTFTPPSIPETPADVAMSAAGEQTKTDLLQQKLSDVKAARVAQQPPAVSPVQPPSVPEGMIPNYPKGKNKIGEDVLGKGAYNWVAGQKGAQAPAFWEGMYGTQNVPYDIEQLRSKFNALNEATMAGGEPGIFPDVTGQVTQKGGAYPRPKYVPEYIKGAADPRALAATAVLATIPSLANAGYQAYQGNKEAVHANLKDAWDALKSTATLPYDVSKSAVHGDFGPLKDFLMSMNPATALMNEVSKSDQEKINKMIYKEKVGGGRGLVNPKAVAPY